MWGGEWHDTLRGKRTEREDVGLPPHPPQGDGAASSSLAVQAEAGNEDENEWEEEEELVWVDVYP